MTEGSKRRLIVAIALFCLFGWFTFLKWSGHVSSQTQNRQAATVKAAKQFSKLLAGEPIIPGDPCESQRRRYNSLIENSAGNAHLQKVNREMTELKRQLDYCTSSPTYREYQEKVEKELTPETKRQMKKWMREPNRLF